MILDLLFPKRCIACQSYGSYICDRCINSIKRHKQTCIVCKCISPLGKTHPHCQSHSYLNGIIIATEYKDVIRKSLQSIKYKLTFDILDELLEKTITSKKISECLQQEKIDLCTDIPMYKSKLNMRGFNQSELIAKWIERKYNISYQTTLIKTINTHSQMKLHRNDRIFNVVNSFEIIKNINIENKKILLVDDVTTTSSTLEECAKVLRQSGANCIWGLVIASGR